jgi:hypothetical protein
VVGSSACTTVCKDKVRGVVVVGGMGDRQQVSHGLLGRMACGWGGSLGLVKKKGLGSTRII